MCGGIILQPDVVLTSCAPRSNATITTRVHQSKEARKKAQLIEVKRVCLPDGVEDDDTVKADGYTILVLSKKLTSNKFVQAATISKSQSQFNREDQDGTRMQPGCYRAA